MVDLAARHPGRERWLAAGAVVALLLAAIAIRLPTLSQPLLESHGFRQTQTAYTAVLYRVDGLSLLHPRLPVFGAPFEVPFELPVFQAVASGAMWLGLPPDTAMRVTALLCFAATAILLFGFVRRFAGALAAFVALAVFLFSPFSLLWSRASLIEYLATAAAIGYAWAAIEWRERRGNGLALVAIIAGALACAVKITTGLIYVIPVLAYVAGSDRPGLRGAARARGVPTFLAIVLVPLLVAALWTRHADAIKDANPLTTWLTSDALTTWNFGTLSQRLDIENWLIVVRRVGLDHLGVLLIPLFVAGLVQSSRRSLWLGWGAGGLFGVAVFFNLHVTHDYYQAALAPIVAGLVGVGAAAASRHARLARHAHPAFVAATVGILVVGGMALDRAYWDRAYTAIPASDARRTMARTIAANTSPSERVLVFGLGWSPEVLYYARREGVMYSGHNAIAEALAATDASYRLVVVPAWVSDRTRTTALGHWRSRREVGPGIYRVEHPVS